MKGAVKYLGYFGAGFFFFIFFIFWTFPYDVLKSRIIHQIEDGMGGAYRIKVQKMSAGLLTGFTFKNVEVIKKEEGKELLLLKSPRLKLKPSWLALIRQNTDVAFDLRTAKGEVDGDFLDSPDQMRIRLNFDELSLAELKFLSALYNVNLRGVIDGDFEIKLSKKDMNKNGGGMELTLVNLVLDPMKVKLDPSSPESAMDLPKITLTGPKDSKILGTVNKMDMDIKELNLKGGDLDLSLTGKLMLGARIDEYRMNLEGKMKLSPQLSQAIPMLALFEQQKQPDGTYDLQITGRFNKPSVTVGRFKLPF